MLLFDHCLSLMKSCKSMSYFCKKRKCISNITRRPKDLVYNFWNWKEIRNKWIEKATFFFTKQETQFIKEEKEEKSQKEEKEESHMRHLNKKILLLFGWEKKKKKFKPNICNIRPAAYKELYSYSHINKVINYKHKI